VLRTNSTKTGTHQTPDHRIRTEGPAAMTMQASAATAAHRDESRSRTFSLRDVQAPLSLLLTTVGAIAVIVGSYTAWATFYAGLVQRDGVSGHGKYFIALAVASVLASAVSTRRGLQSMRWIVPAAGAAIALIAGRDLRNLYALQDDPAAAWYVVGRGDGLYIVIAGALLIAASFLAAPVLPTVRRAHIAAAAVAVSAIAGVGMLIAGVYGEYYLHLASGGHAHNHTQALQSAHILTAAGGSLLFAVFTAAIYRLGGAARANRP